MAEKYTNNHFMDFMGLLMGQAYWYGTTVRNCTTSLLNDKKKQYPTPKFAHYSAERVKKYETQIKSKMICADCIGAVKGYFWTNGGDGVKEAIQTGSAIKFTYQKGIPDKSADAMFEYAKSLGLPWGTMATMPELRGIAVRKAGHVGYYNGNGKVREMKGWTDGGKETDLKGRGWTHWYYIPGLKYEKGNEAPVIPTPETPSLGGRVLQRGSKGEDVKMLQTILTDKFGLAVGSTGIDGIFGAKTEEAVKGMQRKVQVVASGIYDTKTHTALMLYLDNIDREDDDDKMNKGYIKVTGKGLSVYVRSGNGTTYGIITVAKSGDKYPYVSTAANGWHCIEVGGRMGWISGKYTERTDK